MRRLPAEWEPQDGVLMIWPPAESDWEDVRVEVEPVFAAIGAAISETATLVMVCEEEAPVRAALLAAKARPKHIKLIPGISCNDTWARDCGPITILEDGLPRLLDFGFNGWGLKFPADQDNLLTARLCERGVFLPPREVPGLWLEGGGLESDGAGTLLATGRCLFSPNRNPHLGHAALESALHQLTGSPRLLCLEQGELAGDDTDAHIDTLARFAPGGGIVYVACDDPADPHFEPLSQMAAELAGLTTVDGKPWRLYPLPWPAATHAPDGHRTPATYANYLIVNGVVLVPTYRQPEADGRALQVIRSAHPGYRVHGIDCLPLLQQHGSLHCLTMQLPRGVLAAKEEK